MIDLEAAFETIYRKAVEQNDFYHALSALHTIKEARELKVKEELLRTSLRDS